MNLRQALKILHANKRGYFADIRGCKEYPNAYLYDKAVECGLPPRKLRAITRINKWYRI